MSTKTTRTRAWSRHGRLAVLALTVGLGAGATAQEPAPDPTARPWVAVFPSQFPPIFQVTDNSVPTGFGIEVMEALAARAKLRIHYRPTPTWEDASNALRAGRADLIPNHGITAERRKDFDFSLPLARAPVSLFVRVDTRDVSRLEDLIKKNRVIATVKSNIAHELWGDSPPKQRRDYNTISEAFTALLAGEADALIYPDAVVEQLALQLDLAHRIRRIGPPLIVVERAIAVRKGHHAALLARLNEEIAEFVNTPSYREIYKRWHGAPPPFWTAARVAYLVAGLLAVVLVLGGYLRLRMLRRANAFNHAVLDAAIEGILTVDTEGRVRSVNRAAEQIFQRRHHDIVGHAVHALLTEAGAERLRSRLRQRLRQPDGASDVFESTGRRPGGETFPVRLGMALASIGGERLFVCSVHDLTEQRRAERDAEYLVDHDPTTGLLNQRGTLLVLANLLALSRRNRQPLSCLDLGIERFTQINDLYGRQVGDTLLVQVAEFLRQHVRDSDIVSRHDDTGNILIARLGGSRFLLVLPNTEQSGAQALAEKLLAGLARLELTVQQEPLRIAGRIGIGCFPEHGETAEDLIACAETALRQAQEHPIETTVTFNADLREQETRTHRWLQRMHTAIEEHRLVLHFQPVMHIADRTVTHYEALVRIQEPDGTLVLPGEFIPIAEKSGHITRIDYRVMELAFSHLAGIEAAGQNISIAVNISGAHLGSDALLRWLTRLFEEGGVLPGHILFEITETTAVRNLLRARAFMEPLVALGCRFVLDDFGVGFTSFAHLRALPVETVKIDGSFVRDLPTNPENRALVKAMTEVAHSLGKNVVAEYVESAAILDILRKLKVDYAQGFHIGRPGPDLKRVTRPD